MTSIIQWLTNTEPLKIIKKAPKVDDITEGWVICGAVDQNLTKKETRIDQALISLPLKASAQTTTLTSRASVLESQDMERVIHRDVDPRIPRTAEIKLGGLLAELKNKELKIRKMQKLQKTGRRN